ncbi:MAG: glycosidase [Planctomycetes bacterium]|jgi:predicted GH43/DUF377 family glycosyl hydrolase|nr:glycoside hydrolase family 130 protein [Phycisphaerae bacterium]NBB96304.1 glycosidase [Planctomycetota bacterium]
MPTQQPIVNRRPEYFLSDDKRVIVRHFDISDPQRIRGVVDRVVSLPKAERAALLERMMRDFGSRHPDIEAAFERSFKEISLHMPAGTKLDAQTRLLLGAYFTMEYSIESAALFNPSIVPHPDQKGIGPGLVRFLMSLRATGEGHLSSIVFRRGIIDNTGRVSLDPAPRYARTARPLADPQFDKVVFRRKLRDVGDYGPIIEGVLRALPDPFTRAELKAALDRRMHQPQTPTSFRRVADELLWVAMANYTLRFGEDYPPTETVIFPATEHESRGMEDLRLVQFIDEDGQARYCGTYTAYDGRRIHPMMLETADFHTFHVSTLSGRYVKNKGMALFPRKIDGYYVMLARHDGENNYLMRSHNLYVWNTSHPLQTPKRPWELMQLGNCGPPLETEAGWIVLTHGVGPMREYCIGAILLNRGDPAKVIGRLREPLLAPMGEEREGYVPNVVYSCGSMIHEDMLVIPYAVSDSRTAFATAKVDDLLGRMLDAGP